MQNLRKGRSLGEQYILLKKKERKLTKKFVQLKDGAVLAAARIIKTMTSVERRIKFLKEAADAVHQQS